MKLLHSPMSHNSRRCAAVVRHLDAPVAIEVVDIMKGGHKSADFLVLNPNGMVPTLVDGDEVLWESDAINVHVAAAVGSSLWPEGSLRGDVLRWMLWRSAHFGNACEDLIWQNMLLPMQGQPTSDDVREQALGRFQRFAGVLDTHLAERDFLVGDALTLADFSLAACLHYREPAKIPVGDHAHVARWLAGIEDLPAWER
ncbi:MAG: glutathione S-transferase family protein [Polyangiaceae bacterium]